jgi:DNA-directed RNA polymerase specialized sigma24 family protein
MVDYAAWLEGHDPALLAGIEDYNRADCESLADLRDWLCQLSTELAESRAGELPPHLAEIATEPDLRARLVAAHRARDGARVVRHTLVALDYEEGAEPSELAQLLGVSADEVAAWLVHGKKELGIPVSIDDLHG